MNNFAKAFELSQAAIKADPENPENILVLADLMSAHGQSVSETVKLYQQVIELIAGGKAVVGSPGWDKQKALAVCYQNLAALAARQDKIEEAIQNYDRAVALNPSDPFNYFARSLLHKYRFNVAADVYSKLLTKRDPPLIEINNLSKEAQNEAAYIVSDLNKFIERANGTSRAVFSPVVEQEIGRYSRFKSADSRIWLNNVLNDRNKKITNKP